MGVDFVLNSYEKYVQPKENWQELVHDDGAAEGYDGDGDGGGDGGDGDGYDDGATYMLQRQIAGVGA